MIRSQVVNRIRRELSDDFAGLFISYIDFPHEEVVMLGKVPSAASDKAVHCQYVAVHLKQLSDKMMPNESRADRHQYSLVRHAIISR